MAVHCSVVIPTKNGMPRFKEVLSAVRAQRADWPFEIVVVDSGSRDGTLQFARSLADVRVLSVSPESFGHGRTRNFAISQSSGDFIALLTQDALPASSDWLATLVACVEQDDRIAGAFGRHIAYPEADVFTAGELARHFAGFLKGPHVVDRFLDPERYASDPSWRQFLHYFSSNNCCLRKSVWLQHPFPDVEFAEDQIWADEILREGLRKAYCHDAVVFHSHSFGLIETFQRAFDESMSFRALFGYALCPNVRAIFRAVRDRSRQDMQSLSDNQTPRSSTALASRIGKNFAVVLGQYAGAKSASLPVGVVNLLSRDRRLRRMRAG